MDFTNPIVQASTLALVGVLCSALIAAYVSVYLKRRDLENQTTISRKEELDQKAHANLEHDKLLVHDLARYRTEIREEYESILKDDRTRIAASEEKIEVYKLQIAELQINLKHCQDNHLQCTNQIAEMTIKLDTITERLTQHEILSVEDEEYIKCLQEDLLAAGIPVRVRKYSDHTI